MAEDQNKTSGQSNNNENKNQSYEDFQRKDVSDFQWIDNSNQEVDQVFGFNENAELVNARAAMIGFIMLLLTELIFKGKPVTMAIFGIN